MFWSRKNHSLWMSLRSFFVVVNGGGVQDLPWAWMNLTFGFFSLPVNFSLFLVPAVLISLLALPLLINFFLKVNSSLPLSRHSYHKVKEWLNCPIWADVDNTNILKKKQNKKTPLPWNLVFFLLFRLVSLCEAETGNVQSVVCLHSLLPL